MKFQVAASFFLMTSSFGGASTDLDLFGSEKIASLRKKHAHRNLQVGSTALEAAQTFFVPLPDKKLFDETFEVINNDASSFVNSIISISFATAGTIIYYDHSEDGYEDNPMLPTQSSTEIWGDGDSSNGCRPDITSCSDSDDYFVAGDSLVLDNQVPNNRDPETDFYYDGGDQVQSLYPVALTRGAYPGGPGSMMAGAVEVFDTKYWGLSYKLPIDQKSIDYSLNSFQYVGYYFMACEDDTTLYKNGQYLTTLQKGQSYSKRATGSNSSNSKLKQGDMITSDKKVQLNLLTGDVNSSYELRWYSQRPYEEWSSSYLSPVGDTEARTEIVVYNPHDKQLKVKWTTNAESKNMWVEPNSIVWSWWIATGSACELTAERPFTALSISDTVGSGQIFDWGFPLTPTHLLTSTALIGWGYGCTSGDCTDNNWNTQDHARSVVFVTPVEDAKIYVDYDNDGTVDDSYNCKRLDAVRISNPNGDLDMSGAIIWATEEGTGKNGPQTAIAVAWGQAGSNSFGGDYKALDLGTVVVPFTPISATKTLILTNDANNDGQVNIGDTIRYEIELINVGTSNIDEGLITIEDTLDSCLAYQASTTNYKVDGNITPIADAANNGFPLDPSVDGILSQADLPKGAIHYIQFSAMITSSCGASILNEGVATVWGNEAFFEHTKELGTIPRSFDLFGSDDECPEEL